MHCNAQTSSLPAVDKVLHLTVMSDVQLEVQPFTSRFVLAALYLHYRNITCVLGNIFLLVSPFWCAIQQFLYLSLN